LVALERAALERWGAGDPDGFLNLSSEGVVYFDPFQPQRVNGIDALRRIYDSLRGKVHIDSFEILDPQVNAAGDMALLTFNLRSRGSEGEMCWHTTEVYRRIEGQWRIVHSHWSLAPAKPGN